ncbi:energy-coupling factor transporter transmembrane component T family protein [Nonomuraea jabiensis]|uniref:Biotin transport system permease protein n=1 Tax=Nonomuraea jabiensis TaxID=882448 RepID=A0A7W9GG74_9ACTN|nr:energy-coupling factor transporter transmembrane protein EcfT [Nonomuraea jabiensis]MBB5783245.1 biotin transport system permease protein [Nonomuraea jabiensis]
MNTFGVYVPGDSLLHRLPAGAKLLALLVVISATLFVRDPVAALTCAALVCLAYPVSRVGIGHLGTTVVGLLPFLVVILAFQTFTAGWRTAVVLSAQLFTAVVLAGLVTLTTRVADMLELFERLARPLRAFGVRPERVALVLALTIRSVPMALTAWRQAREAYVARGLSRRQHHMVVPVIVSLIRSAEAVGEAISARGLD